MIGIKNLLIVGTNFDWNMFGFESDPLELIIEVTAKLRDKLKSIPLLKFASVEDLSSQVNRVLNKNKSLN